MLEYLKWCLGETLVTPDRTIVVVLDGYGVHLDKAIDDMLGEIGHGVMRIGGGITPDVQVGDTHNMGRLRNCIGPRKCSTRSSSGVFARASCPQPRAKS